jgi:hypothetical protein
VNTATASFNPTVKIISPNAQMPAVTFHSVRLGAYSTTSCSADGMKPGTIGPIPFSIQAPCRMCTELPCVAACEPLALRFDVPAKMGTAVISALDCLAHQNTTCSACVEPCPVEGAMTFENGRPVTGRTAER